MKKSLIWIIFAIVVIVAIIVFFIVKNPNMMNPAANPGNIGNTGSGGNSNNSNSNGNTQTTTPKTYNVGIKGFAFSPSTLTINKGDTVTWTNMDSTTHTVTSDSGSELASANMQNGQSFSHVFNTAGTFNYHCSIHTSMKGEIVVQ